MSEELVYALNHWLNREYDNPSRGDYYLIQLTHIVASMFSEKKIDMETWKLLFGKKEEYPRTDERRKYEQAEYQKAVAALSKYQFDIAGAKVRKGNILEDKSNGIRARSITHARTPCGRLLGFGGDGKEGN